MHQLIDVESLTYTPLTLKNGKRRKQKIPATGIAARSELNGTFFEDDLELITGRKKFLVYGEYAGGFDKFDRFNELDQNDEVDRGVKESWIYLHSFTYYKQRRFVTITKFYSRNRGP